ncbi:hypothetical protein BpJC7_28890 [Weizmannia acidilactici]|uniref:Uncharacterized protein n=1 Tax=Weizmannia acidilactici TaxID=2607726 RepID=A0A5J4J9V2_9BACI|nr:hypothetical protein BpJC4_01930 [Weizmannia acidilactici]GER71586.1 hypothetical protein BpJC7_28890 [Weizmannia acidilactici]GER72078.1 hypothetical protein BpPP18_01450 [Weizmannia acidilactici]
MYHVREKRILELKPNSEAKYAALYITIRKTHPVAVRGDVQGVLMQLVWELL